MKYTLAALALLAGCTDVPDESTTASAIYGGGSWETSDCPHSDCGMNTSDIRGVFFGVLHLGGKPNDAGVVLQGYLPWTMPNGATKLSTRTNKLVAIDNFGNVKAQGLGLKG